MNWDNVEMIRNAQASNQKRFDEEHIAVQSSIEKAMQSETFKQLAVPRMTELETMIFKMRSELIDYIVAHGLVDGMILDGVLQPVENGKIVLTKELIATVCEKLGYYKEEDVLRFVEQYLPEHDYVSDGEYVHTDNNFRDEDVTKLNGIEDGAEVNKIIDLIFNGVSVLDDGTRVATITITPEDIKRWYESNANTNAYTDAEKAKLAGISDGAEVNRVDDIYLDGVSIVDDKKHGILTADAIKKSYESNADTNAFTDAEKLRLADINSLRVFAINANGLKSAERGSETELDGTCKASLTAKITLTSDEKKTQTRTVELKGAIEVSDNEILGEYVALAYSNPECATDGLQSISIHGTNDLDIIAEVVVNADNFHAVKATIEFVRLNLYAMNVLDVLYDGDSVVDSEGKAIIHSQDLSGYVPYQGATRAVNLSYQELDNVSAIDVSANANDKDKIDITNKKTVLLSDVANRPNGWGLPITFGTSHLGVDTERMDIRLSPENELGVFESKEGDSDPWYTADELRAPFVIGEPQKDYHGATKFYVDNHGINTYNLTYYGGVVSKITGSRGYTKVGAKLSFELSRTDSDTGETVDFSVTLGGDLEIDENGLIKRGQTLTPRSSESTTRWVICAIVTSATSTKTDITFQVNCTWDNPKLSSVYYAETAKFEFEATDNGVQFYNGEAPNWVLSEEGPIERKHLANKGYVDDEIKKAGSSALKEVESSDSYDICVMEMTADVSVTTGAISSYDVISNEWTSGNEQFTLRKGQRVIFSRWYNGSSTVNYRSVAPVSRTMWLYFTSTNSVISVYNCGVYGSANTSCDVRVPKFVSITTGDIEANCTRKYYRFT